MLVHPAGAGPSTSALRSLATEPAARRRGQGTRWRRLPAGRQAPPVPAHPRCGPAYARLAAGSGVGTTTAHRYAAEAADVLASFAPTPAEAVEVASTEAFVILDGTLLPIDWGHLPGEGWGRSPPTGLSAPGSTRSTA